MDIGNAMMLVLLGAGMYVVSGTLVNNMEAKGDYESPLHMSLVFILAHGMLLNLIGMIRSYQWACDKVGISYHMTYSLRDKAAGVKRVFEKLRKNVKAAVTPKTLILLAVGFLLVGILSPIAIGTIFNATTTGWNTSVKTVFQVVLPIIYVVGVAIYLIPGGKH